MSSPNDRFAMRVNARHCGALVLSGLMVTGCEQGSAPDTTPALTVGGKPLSQGLARYYVRAKSGADAERIDPTLRASLLADLARLKAAALAAERAAKPDTGYALEIQRLELLAKAAAADAGVYAAPSESEVNEAYDRFVAEHPVREYRVAHILVATEAMAVGLVRRLHQGEAFADLAKQESADDSRAHGGELGWVHAGHLPTAFTDAVKGLDVGDYTNTPVKTPYGWHVIRLLEVRATGAPPLQTVRAQLVANLQQDRYRTFLDAAGRSTTVEYIDARPAKR